VFDQWSGGNAMPTISPFLWFDSEAEHAAKFYMSVFPNSRILQIARYTDAGPGPKGSVMVVDFEIDGQRITALNGGPHFKFTEAISLVVHCKTQDEVDEYWTKLTAGGGQEGQCGWLKDKYGLSWQIVPDPVTKMLADTDGAKVNRVMQAVLAMKKPDIAAAQRAYAG
jgi:predicted 3-demethylubiquinone-9 3-methyltransferase (glyoxalase superfamily)